MKEMQYDSTALIDLGYSNISVVLTYRNEKGDFKQKEVVSFKNFGYKKLFKIFFRKIHGISLHTNFKNKFMFEEFNEVYEVLKRKNKDQFTFIETELGNLKVSL